MTKVDAIWAVVAFLTQPLRGSNHVTEYDIEQLSLHLADGLVTHLAAYPWELQKPTIGAPQRALRLSLLDHRTGQCSIPVLMLKAAQAIGLPPQSWAHVILIAAMRGVEIGRSTIATNVVVSIDPGCVAIEADADYWVFWQHEPRAMEERPRQIRTTSDIVHTLSRPSIVARHSSSSGSSASSTATRRPSFANQADDMNLRACSPQAIGRPGRDVPRPRSLLPPSSTHSSWRQEREGTVEASLLSPSSPMDPPVWMRDMVDQFSTPMPNQVSFSVPDVRMEAPTKSVARLERPASTAKYVPPALRNKAAAAVTPTSSSPGPIARPHGRQNSSSSLSSVSSTSTAFRPPATASKMTGAGSSNVYGDLAGSFSSLSISSLSAHSVSSSDERTSSSIGSTRSYSPSSPDSSATSSPVSNLSPLTPADQQSLHTFGHPLGPRAYGHQLAHVSGKASVSQPAPVDYIHFDELDEDEEASRSLARPMSFASISIDAEGKQRSVTEYECGKVGVLGGGVMLGARRV